MDIAFYHIAIILLMFMHHCMPAVKHSGVRIIMRTEKKLQLLMYIHTHSMHIDTKPLHSDTNIFEMAQYKWQAAY